MTRCLKIFGAYSYRLTRRHSTLLLIASILITITVILHLYNYRHHHHYYRPTEIYEFDYQPGSFLKGQQPNENKTYCQFNYGLPETLKWGSYAIMPTPEAGTKSPYRVIYNAIIGTAYANHSKYNAVTYATQATTQYIYHIIEIARYWEGPISLAVFVPNYDLDITMQIMTHLCHCYPGMAKVSLHLFYPKKNPPKIASREQRVVTTEMPTTTSNITVEELLQKKLDNYKKLDGKTRFEYIQKARKSKIERMMMRMPIKRTVAPDLEFYDCSEVASRIPDNHLRYYINVGRNVARNASRTNYFILSDIEMVPSDGLAPKFLAMVRKLMGDKKRDKGFIFPKTVFVVPLFEVERGEEIPRDKNTLVRMVTANQAKYFHQRLCSHCQRFPGLQTWLTRTPSSVLEPILIARREYPFHRWEPLYFGTQNEPWYSESLSWEGKQDKMTQMLEMCLQEYRLVVLDGGFLCHSAAHAPSRYNRAERANMQQYTKIVAALRERYPDRPACKLMWGCKTR